MRYGAILVTAMMLALTSGILIDTGEEADAADVVCERFDIVLPEPHLVGTFFDVVITLYPADVTNMRISWGPIPDGLKLIWYESGSHILATRFKGLEGGTYTLTVTSGDGAVTETVSVTAVSILEFTGTPASGQSGFTP